MYNTYPSQTHICEGRPGARNPEDKSEQPPHSGLASLKLLLLLDVM